MYYNNTYKPRLLVSDESGSLLAGNGYLFDFGYIDACEITKFKVWNEDFEETYESDYSGFALDATWYGTRANCVTARPCFHSTFKNPIFVDYTQVDADGSEINNLSLDAGCELPAVEFTPRSSDNYAPVLTTDEQGINYISTRIGIITFSQTGELISNDFSPIGNLVSMAYLSDGYFAIVKEDSTLHLYQRSTDSLEFSTPAYPLDLLPIDSTLWYITKDSLCSLNLDFERNTYPLPTMAYGHLRMINYQGRPLLYRNGWRNASDEGYGWIFDPSAPSYTNVMAWDFGFDMLSITPFTQDSLYVSGWLTDVGYFVKKATLDDFAFQPRRDVGVTDVALEVMEVSPTPWEGDIQVKLRATVEVTNFGTTPVSSLCIRHKRSFSGPFQCVPNQIVVEETLDLAAGETQSFVTEDVRHVFVNAENGQQTLTKTFYTFCPDHYLDADPSNDSLTVSLTLTSTAESTLPNGAIRLSPNPASDAVQVQADYPLGQLLLTDAYGRTVRQMELTPAHKEWMLQRNGLPAGLYYLRVKNGERWEVQKLVFKN